MRISDWSSDVCSSDLEAVYVVAICILSLAGIWLTWRGEMFAWLSQGCSTCQPMVFNRYSYLFFSGVLGGTLFGLKYLYKVVARGWWNEDRELWRFFSPLLAGGLAFAVGALADRSEEPTSDLQSLMRISTAVF